MTPSQIVFLTGVDNTLLDDDRIPNDLSATWKVNSVRSIAPLLMGLLALWYNKLKEAL